MIQVTTFDSALETSFNIFLVVSPAARSADTDQNSPDTGHRCSLQLLRDSYRVGYDIHKQCA